MTARPYQPPHHIHGSQTTRRGLPESIAFAAHEFISGPLLENPHRVGKELMPPARQAQRPTRHVSRAVSNQRCGHDSHRSGGGSTFDIYRNRLTTQSAVSQPRARLGCTRFGSPGIFG